MNVCVCANRYNDHDDDCSDMEANYSQIQAEEKRRLLRVFV